MESLPKPSEKLSSINPQWVLVPFYCACILLLGANLFRDHCCQEVRQQNQAAQRSLQEIKSRLSQMERHLAAGNHPSGPQIDIPISVSPEIPGAEAGNFLAQLGVGILTDLIVDRITSFLDDEDQVPVVRNEIKNQVINYFRGELRKRSRGEIPIYFDVNSAEVPASGRQLIGRFRAWVREHPGQRVTISGFADRIGKPMYNRELAMRRAKAVASLMTDLQARIEIEPIEDEDHLPVFTADEVSEPCNRMVVIRWKDETQP